MKNEDFEFTGMKMSGFIMLFLIIVFIAAGISAGIFDMPALTYVAIVLVALISPGFILLEPNEARAMVFFGNYKGTFVKTGFWWVNPFMTRKSITLRARNLNVAPIKVNDKNGNPIMIGLVLVWRINNVYKSMFEIDSQTMANGKANSVTGLTGRMNAFESFVAVQSDAALRQVAGLFSYDNNNSDEEITLRGGGAEVNSQLEEKLNAGLMLAGIEIVEARINYLAYAPEIAAVMLRRQQADAIIAAREKIVEGAVTMVKMALDKLTDEKVVEFDEDKKATMVSNLLVVLCADESVTPVINTGTIHQ